MDSSFPITTRLKLNEILYNSLHIGYITNQEIETLLLAGIINPDLPVVPTDAQIWQMIALIVVSRGYSPISTMYQLVKTICKNNNVALPEYERLKITWAVT